MCCSFIHNDWKGQISLDGKIFEYWLIADFFIDVALKRHHISSVLSMTNMIIIIVIIIIIIIPIIPVIIPICILF